SKARSQANAAVKRYGVFDAVFLEGMSQRDARRHKVSLLLLYIRIGICQKPVVTNGLSDFLLCHHIGQDFIIADNRWLGINRIFEAEFMKAGAIDGFVAHRDDIIIPTPEPVP